jgi:hypothetical protein
MAKPKDAEAKSLRVYHVVPKSSGGWAIKRDGIAKTIKVFAKKTDAVKFAREISRKQGSNLVIHGRDGKVVSVQKHGATVQHKQRPESGFGCAKGLIIILPEFDESPEEFNEYI